jgi:flagellar motor switch protein FliN/FliY
MADDSNQINQDEIEELLRQSRQGAAGSTPAPGPAAGPPPAAKPAADPGGALSQDDIEALLAASQAAQAAPSPARPAAAAPPPVQAAHASHPPAAGHATHAPPPTAAVASSTMEPPIAADDIELLLNRAERALASAQSAGSTELPPGVAPFKFEDFNGAPASTEAATIELIRDVELDLKIELGRTQMYLEDVLKLRKGAVVPLDKLAGDPVDIYVNGRLIARGEVLVLNDNFCVRVAELVSGDVAGPT